MGGVTTGVLLEAVPLAAAAKCKSFRNEVSNSNPANRQACLGSSIQIQQDVGGFKISVDRSRVEVGHSGGHVSSHLNDLRSAWYEHYMSVDVFDIGTWIWVLTMQSHSTYIKMHAHCPYFLQAAIIPCQQPTMSQRPQPLAFWIFSWVHPTAPLIAHLSVAQRPRLRPVQPLVQRAALQQLFHEAHVGRRQARAQQPHDARMAQLTQHLGRGVRESTV